MGIKVWRIKSQSHTLAFLCLVVFLDAISVGLIMPVMPALIQSLSVADVGRAAEIGGYLLFTFALMQFLCAPAIGGLSDRYGRRPVLLIAVFGFSLSYFVLALAPTLTWLFIARAISGVLGATQAAANAAMVDITPAEKRARNFGLISASFGAGFVFGPAVGGILGEIAPRLPFIAAGAVTLLSCVYGFFVMPETLSLEKRRSFSAGRANPFGSIMAVGKHKTVLGVLAALFFAQLATQSYNSIWAFFTIEVFDWSPRSIGFSVTLYGIVFAVVQGFLTGPVVARVGEMYATVFSMFLATIAYAGLGFADEAGLVYFWICVGGLSGFALPSMQSVMSKHTAEDQQGELQGAVASSFSFTTIIGPIAMTQAFSAFTGDGYYFPGAPFIGSAGLALLSVFVFYASVRRLRANKPAA
ncbi:MAG: TCR/Tet family MFS transporter [Pseudomonadota bacterium]